MITILHRSFSLIMHYQPIDFSFHHNFSSFYIERIVKAMILLKKGDFNMKKDIVLKVGSKIPSEIAGEGRFMAAWWNDSMNLFICDCQNEKEAKIFKETKKIELSISRINEVLFFLVGIPELSLLIDIPYNVNLTPLEEENIKNGFSNLYIYFCSPTKTIQSIRGLHLTSDTQEKLGNLFLREFDSLTDDPQEYMNIVDKIYKRYPRLQDMEEREVMTIKWRYKTEFS